MKFLENGTRPQPPTSRYACTNTLRYVQIILQKKCRLQYSHYPHASLIHTFISSLLKGSSAKETYNFLHSTVFFVMWYVHILMCLYMHVCVSMCPCVWVCLCSSVCVCAIIWLHLCVCYIHVENWNLWIVSILLSTYYSCYAERWGAGVETQKNLRGEFGGWGRVPFNEPYAPVLSTIYDGA